MAQIPSIGGEAGSNTSSSPSAGTSPGGTPAMWIYLGGAVLAIVFADPFPHLVNGILALVLIGLILKSQDAWIPWLKAGTISAQQA